MSKRLKPALPYDELYCFVNVSLREISLVFSSLHTIRTLNLQAHTCSSNASAKHSNIIIYNYTIYYPVLPLVRLLESLFNYEYIILWSLFDILQANNRYYGL